MKGDIQTQALAVSSDGVHFKKQGVILSGEKLPADCSRHDFRDPYVFLKDGVYYMLCGSQAKDEDRADIAVPFERLPCVGICGKVDKRRKADEGDLRVPLRVYGGRKRRDYGEPAGISHGGLEIRKHRFRGIFYGKNRF